MPRARSPAEKRAIRAKARARALRRGPNRWSRMLRAASNKAWTIYRNQLKAGDAGAPKPTGENIRVSAHKRMELLKTRMQTLREKAIRAAAERKAMRLQHKQGVAVAEATGVRAC